MAYLTAICLAGKFPLTEIYILTSSLPLDDKMSQYRPTTIAIASIAACFDILNS